jgi:S-methylmethionine-dependent homocysteine/selenocysteine methylase
MNAQDTLILDGGFSRELIALGAPFAQPEWSALALLTPSAHDQVRQAHINFARAGSDIIITNSYAIVPFHIGEERFRSRGRELAKLSGRLAREAADAENARRKAAGETRMVRVAGGLPPIFGSYEPQLFDSSRVAQYLDVLVSALDEYVDIWLGETLSLIAEAEAVVDAVRHTNKPIWISFTVDDRKVSVSDAVQTAILRSGESVSSAAAWIVQQDDVDALLFNCSRPEYMLSAVQKSKETFTKLSEGKSAGQKRIGVYANKFEPQGENYHANEGTTKLRDDLDMETYMQFAQDWVSAGASIVGGCCGIGSEYIVKLHKELSTNEKNGM